MANFNAIFCRNVDFDDFPLLYENDLVNNFYTNEWRTSIKGLINSVRGEWINPPESIINNNKITQLHIACESGLRIPSTIVSNDFLEVNNFLEKNNFEVISKVVDQHFISNYAQDFLYGVFPHKITVSDLKLLKETLKTPIPELFTAQN